MKTSIAISAMLMLAAASASANMLMPEGGQRVKAFSTQNDRVGWTAVVKGAVVSFSSKDEFDSNDLIGSSQEKSKATVRLYNDGAVSEGDTLYVINDRNLVVARMRVRSVFRSTSFGEMLVGYGNFRLGSVGDRVIQKAEDANAKYAYIYKARGDYYDSTGDEGEAIREYKEALKLDRNSPEAHFALGMMYRKQGLDQFAFKEFQEGYRNIGRLYDRGDRYLLIKNMVEIRYREVYASFLPEKKKAEYREQAKALGREALRIHPRSEEINYYLGVLYYRPLEQAEDDRTSRDYFLKVIEINPMHSNAYVYLARLYKKHENLEKAKMYADKALESDMSNPLAQSLVKELESKLEVK